MLLKVATLCVLAAVYWPCNTTSTSDITECEVITVHTCMGSSVIHKYTSVPTTRRVSRDPGDGFKTYRNQKKAMEGKRKLVSRLKGRAAKACKAVMKPFMCAAYLPFCDENSQVILPCRDFCIKAQTLCQDHYNKLGVEWPDDLDCSLFPSTSESPRCLSGLNVHEPRISSLTPSSVDVEVKCNYDLLPRKRPMWLKNGVPVEDYSSRMQNVYVQSTSYSTLLVIKHFVDSMDGGHYTCVVGEPWNYEFERSINLDNIFQLNVINTTTASAVSQEPVEPSECPPGQIPCPLSDRCISLSSLCNGVEDCPSGMDEMDCKDGGHVPLSECPSGQIPCLLGDQCIPLSAMCDGVEDCTDGYDEQCGNVTEPVEPPECPPGQIPCPLSDRCISLSSLCNGVEDCPSGMDEMDCKDGGHVPPSQCPSGQIPCLLGDQCIPLSAMCDGVEDCTDGYDEQCGNVTEPVEPSECQPGQIPCPLSDRCISLSSLCNGVEDCPSGMDEMDCKDGGHVPPSQCPSGQIPCLLGDQCIPLSAMCDGVEDCSDGYDEQCGNVTEPVEPSECPPGHIPCPLSDRCISLSSLCNGVEDCPSGVDEMDCKDGGHVPPSQCPSGQIPCLRGDQCIPLSAMCDGVEDCSDGYDEQCGNATACLPITVTECSHGLDYKETILGYNAMAISQDNIATIIGAISTLFNTSCGTFFRPFLCATFLPPCGQQIQLPCRELCHVAFKQCVEYFDGQLTEEDMLAQAQAGSTGGCAALPTQTDGQCYNVKEVTIGYMVASASETSLVRYVDCTYNLLPKFKPMWATPDGSKVKNGTRRPMQAIHISDSVTRLQISQPDIHGVFTCSGREYSDTIEF